MKALSIRQPWAWLILNAGKDIENRDWYTGYRGRFLIHASKGMTRDEYENGVYTLADIRPDLKLPEFEALERGGIVGTALLVGCARKSESPWFFGEYGFMLRDVAPLPFRPYRGQLGFFEVPDEGQAEADDATREMLGDDAAFFDGEIGNK
jgi:ASCH domain